jgi:hypothetical protein
MERYGSSTDAVTAEELRDAGASAVYVAYYKAAQKRGESTASTRHAEKVVRRGIEYSGGGFHESVWSGEPRFPHNSDNPYGADGQNSQILGEAGVEPYCEVDEVWKHQNL